MRGLSESALSVTAVSKRTLQIIAMSEMDSPVCTVHHTAESDSPVCTVHHTADSDSPVCTVQCASYCRVWLPGVYCASYCRVWLLIVQCASWQVIIKKMFRPLVALKGAVRYNPYMGEHISHRGKIWNIKKWGFTSFRTLFSNILVKTKPSTNIF